MAKKSPLKQHADVGLLQSTARMYQSGFDKYKAWSDLSSRVSEQWSDVAEHVTNIKANQIKEEKEEEKALSTYYDEKFTELNTTAAGNMQEGYYDFAHSHLAEQQEHLNEAIKNGNEKDRHMHMANAQRFVKNTQTRKQDFASHMEDYSEGNYSGYMQNDPHFKLAKEIFKDGSEYPPNAEANGRLYYNVPDLESEEEGATKKLYHDELMSNLKLKDAKAETELDEHLKAFSDQISKGHHEFNAKKSETFLNNLLANDDTLLSFAHDNPENLDFKNHYAELVESGQAEPVVMDPNVEGYDADKLRVAVKDYYYKQMEREFNNNLKARGIMIQETRKASTALSADYEAISKMDSEQLENYMKVTYGI
jgi:hypothetical protein